MDPLPILQELRAFAVTLPFELVDDVEPEPEADCGSDWLLPVDEAGRLRGREWESTGPGPRSYRLASMQALEGWSFRIEAGDSVETFVVGLARHPPVWPVGDDLQPTGLDGSCRWHRCCKTDHALQLGRDHFVGCHGRLIEVLDRAAELGIVGQVRDETGFHTHRDWDQACDAAASMQAAIAHFVGAFQDALDQAEPAPPARAPVTQRRRARRRP